MNLFHGLELETKERDVRRRLSVIVAAASFLPACVTITDPVPMGEDRYMITLNARGGFSSDGELLTKSIQKAGNFCAAKGLTADIVNTKATGVQMWTPQDNQVVFKCVTESK